MSVQTFMIERIDISVQKLLKNLFDKARTKPWINRVNALRRIDRNTYGITSLSINKNQTSIPTFFFQDWKKNYRKKISNDFSRINSNTESLKAIILTTISTGWELISRQIIDSPYRNRTFLGGFQRPPLVSTSLLFTSLTTNDR